MQATRRATSPTGELAADEITPDAVRRHLDTAGIPDPDLVIRTSGEERLSNFLLWQAAYSELLFLPCYWPDFNRDDLAEALRPMPARTPFRRPGRRGIAS